MSLPRPARTDAADRPGTAGCDAQPAVRLAGLGTALPAHRVEQRDVLGLLPRLWPRLARHLGQLGGELESGTRYFERRPEELVVPLPLGEQTARYRRAAAGLAAEAARAALGAAGVRAGDIGLLVVSSCTGFVLPGLDAALVPGLGLRRDVWRMPFTQFGCGGGAAGLALATDWVRGHPSQRALVVAVELPSLTFRPGDTSTDNLLSALVFGDGAGAAVLEASGVDGSAPNRTGSGGGVRIGRVRCELIPLSQSMLGYELADDGYRVILSRRLSDALAAALPGMVTGFLGAGAVAGFDAVAVHPGGRRIVEVVAACLGLDAAQVAASTEVVRGIGNTSSAGIFFVLEEMARSPHPPGGRGLALGFGPGLGVQLLELEWGC